MIKVLTLIALDGCFIIRVKVIAINIAEMLRNVACNGRNIMNKKGYTMQEIADILGVNKSSVFRQLKKGNIAPAMKEGNTNYYNATTLKQLKQHFKANANKETKKDILVETLQQQVHQLQSELAEEKARTDKQLQEKDNQINNLHKLLDQSQQLILNAQEENKKLLPDTKDNQQVQAGEYREQSSSSTQNDGHQKSSDDKAILDKVNGKKVSWFHRFFG